MSVIDWASSLLDEFEAGQRINEEIVDQSKSRPGEAGLKPMSKGTSSLPVVRPPTARPAVDSRAARKEAIQEQSRLQHIVWETQRTALANNSIVAVVVHAQQQLDAAQEAMLSRYVGVKRTETGNEYIGQLTVKLLALLEASVLAVVESHPKRIAEEL